MILVVLLVATILGAADRPPAVATAHALDELANCRAQQRPECPTATPTLTATPTPTFTPTVAPTVTPTPTDTPEPVATLESEPCWLIDQEWGDPDNNYIVFDELGMPVPCPTDEAIEEPTPEPTFTPTPRPSPTQTVVVVMVYAPPPTAQVVYVQVTPTPVSTPVPQPTLTPTATRTSSPTATPTRTPRPTFTPTLRTTSTPTVVPTPVSVAQVRQEPEPEVPFTVDPESQRVPVPMLILGVWVGLRPTGAREWSA